MQKLVQGRPKDCENGGEMGSSRKPCKEQAMARKTMGKQRKTRKTKENHDKTKEEQRKATENEGKTNENHRIYVNERNIEKLKSKSKFTKL